eukprot:NODE_23998_length_642_cov_4.774757.p2 GENE.NODE_23998_length_642_cov_4.774757~~NODE_23998_length_642_cov_4.774757.p2  ORF type:complete len:101 (-),score=1.62 NODE_23998_length_642_cov_4.774757:340-597(-)
MVSKHIACANRNVNDASPSHIAPSLASSASTLGLSWRGEAKGSLHDDGHRSEDAGPSRSATPLRWRPFKRRRNVGCKTCSFKVFV